MAGLIHHSDKYWEAGMNVLLVADHGIGKTESVFQLAAKHGIKVAYYNCATLDPWTDLVGVPFPKEVIGEDGKPMDKRILEMVRPTRIDDAELIFFDELNRADSKTQNACFEIVQFRTINGEPLPKLRCCWAAMNPPGEVYQVEELDPAFIDRFDAYVALKPRPSIPYMKVALQPLAEKAGCDPEKIATALRDWWSDHNKKRSDDDPSSYVSPRRLVKIGQVFLVTDQVKPSMPPFGTFDDNKLLTLLQEAKKRGSSGADGKGLAGKAGFSYTPEGLLADEEAIIAFLKSNPANVDTQQAVSKVLKDIETDKLATDYLRILSSISRAMMEGWIRKHLGPNRSARLAEALKQHKGGPLETEATLVHKVITNEVTL